MADQKKVAIIGSGNWGSAIAKIVGDNVVKFDKFENRVPIYVFEEVVDGKKLTEIINTTHENVKYLPGHKLPENVVAVPDIVETCKDADILVFVFPHQFLRGTLSPLIGKLKPGAVGISLIKGFDLLPGGGLRLISEAIKDILEGIDVSVLMGANIANEVAEGKLCETTIGSSDLQVGKMLKELMQAEDFRVVVVDDVATVEICGALKNIVACAAGFIDGLGYGGNTKAAVIRLGLMEMIKYTEQFYPGCKMSTFFESCGVADLITTCYGGRNRKVSDMFAKTGKSISELEAEMLNGQKLQGPETAKEVNVMLKNRGLEERFPLFTAVHLICEGQKPVAAILDSIRSHPEHLELEPDHIKFE